MDEVLFRRYRRHGRSGAALEKAAVDAIDPMVFKVYFCIIFSGVAGGSKA